MHFFEITLLVLIAIQLGYLIPYLIAFQRKAAPLGKSSDPVSVVVCAHDEEQNLRELIPLILEQEYHSFEVIVVEDRSNDDSFDYLYDMASKNPKLRLIPLKSKPEHVNGKKFALTLGIKAAKNEWVLLTDADCRPNSNKWIQEMSGQFSDNKAIVLGYSPYEKSQGLLNSLIRFECLFTAIQYIGMAIARNPYMGVGRNLAYRKSLFLKNKGFNNHLSITGGDDDLFINEVATKDNTTVCINDASIVYSKPKTTWEDFYIQKIRHLSVGKHYKSGDRIKLGLFSLSYIGAWLVLVPAIAYSCIIYIPIGAFALRIVMFTSLVHRSSRKLGDAFETWKVPFLDFIFVIYYLVIGLVALHTNKIRWKKT